MVTGRPHEGGRQWMGIPRRTSHCFPGIVSVGFRATVAVMNCASGDTPPPDPPRGSVDPELTAALERLRPRLMAFVRLHSDPALRAKESCSDLVQSVYREVLENADRIEYQGDEAFRCWLFTWALNKIRDRQRHWLAQRRDARREVANSATNEHDLLACYQTLCTPSREAMLHEQIERIEAAFDRLPPQYREVITLSRIAGLSHAEIAARTDSTPGAVRTQLNRALVRLTSELERIEGGPAA